MNDLRADGKLAEANFFLRHLARTNGETAAAEFYASATVQALRSVTWALQSDLRPRYGSRFDQWWESHQKALADLSKGFPVIRDARNAASKKGSPLVRRVRRQAVSAQTVSAITFVVDPGHETLANFRLELKRPLARVDLSADDPRPSVDAAVRDMEDVLEAIRQFGVGWARGEGTLFPEFALSQPIPFRDALALLRKYSRDLGRLLRRARVEFAT
jgi:hypothetical protein